MVSECYIDLYRIYNCSVILRRVITIDNVFFFCFIGIFVIVVAVFIDSIFNLIVKKVY